LKAAAAASGKPTGILAPVEADARRYMSMGMSLLAVGSDLGLLRMNSQALRDCYLEQPQGPIAAQY
jgi:2-dehydro-3-deoxyglucarate aldolase